MNAQRQSHYFRRYDRPTASWWRLLPLLILGAFDLYLIFFLVRGLWPFLR